MAETAAPAVDRGERDPFIDFVRAFSLPVVVAWHWVFTILWEADGPHATNPIGFTRGLFVATWLLQVMPLSFFVGGFAHEQAWLARQSRDQTLLRFARTRAVSLARPALALAAAWWLIGSVVVALFDIYSIQRAVLLILSPLWFLVVYVLLVVLFPLAHRLHKRFGRWCWCGPPDWPPRSTSPGLPMMSAGWGGSTWCSSGASATNSGSSGRSSSPPAARWHGCSPGRACSG